MRNGIGELLEMLLVCFVCPKGHVFMVGSSTRRNQKHTVQSCQQQNVTARLMGQKVAQGNC
jgi:hypothetical protein